MVRVVELLEEEPVQETLGERDELIRRRFEERSVLEVSVEGVAMIDVDSLAALNDAQVLPRWYEEDHDLTKQDCASRLWKKKVQGPGNQARDEERDKDP